MVIDISEINSNETRHADVCLIGAGAAGITIAREFVGTGHSVVVLEGGGEIVEPDSQEPYRSEVVGLAHGGVHAGRARAIGGTTTLWAGQALPLIDIDFRKRDWVPYSGWPIGRDTLSPFYRRAEQVMQIPHVTYDANTWPQDDAPPRTTARESCPTSPSSRACRILRPNTVPNLGRRRT
jgi:choline dehydrogenase-like flavoprotein